LHRFLTFCFRFHDRNISIRGIGSQVDSLTMLGMTV
jgi:hypothetical protein